MALSEPARAVVVDFNGTLSLDEHILERIYLDVALERYGVRLTSADYYDRLVGHSDAEIAMLLLQQAGRPDDPAEADELLRERVTRYRAVLGDSTAIPEPAAEAVRALAAVVPLAVVTGASHQEVDHALAASGLRRFFVAVVCVEDVAAGKPDPEGYVTAAAVLAGHVPALSPAEIVAFEDSLVGIAAAKGAGMQVVAVEGSAPRASLERAADAVVGGLDVASAAMVLGRPAGSLA